MTRGNRIATTLGFAVPTALAGWIIIGVDARATQRELVPPWAPSYAAYLVRTSLVRACEPEIPNAMVCECSPRIEVAIDGDRLRAFVVDGFQSEATILTPMSVPRDRRQWTALEGWFARARDAPWLDGITTFRVVASGVPYRDVIRTIEIADHAGFEDARLVPPQAAESPLALVTGDERLGR